MGKRNSAQPRHFKPNWLGHTIVADGSYSGQLCCPAALAAMAMRNLCSLRFCGSIHISRRNKRKSPIRASPELGVPRRRTGDVEELR